MPSKNELPCRTLDPDLWFPVSLVGPGARQAEQAKTLCITKCPIRQECLDQALALNAMGIWGGTDENERKLIHATRSQADAQMAHAG